MISRQPGRCTNANVHAGLRTDAQSSERPILDSQAMRDAACKLAWFHSRTHNIRRDSHRSLNLGAQGPDRAEPVVLCDCAGPNRRIHKVVVCRGDAHANDYAPNRAHARGADAQLYPASASASKGGKGLDRSAFSAPLTARTTARDSSTGSRERASSHARMSASPS